MTTVDDALTEASAGREDGSVPAAAMRGRLIVAERAAQHLVQGVAERTQMATRDVDARVTRLDDEGISAEIHLAVEYPQTPLADALARFRGDVTRRVEELLGRPVRRLDVVVTDLVVGLSRRRRVQ